MRGKGKKPKISCKERQAFLSHRWGAKKLRSIEFHFSYEEWVAWWETNLGPSWFEKRGRRYGEYVMARKGDKGPYATWNVECVTAQQNLKAALGNSNRGNAKLTKAQVTIIYLEVKNGPRGIMPKLARRFKVTEITIRDIKNKMTWNHVTDLLD